jgi:hypothetical protein
VGSLSDDQQRPFAKFFTVQIPSALSEKFAPFFCFHDAAMGCGEFTVAAVSCRFTCSQVE